MLELGEFHTEIVEKLWKRTMNQIRIYTGICLAVLFLVLQIKILLQQHYWYDSNPYYDLLHFLNEWSYLLALGIYMAGCMILLLMAFRRSVHYLDSALEAAGKVADKSNSLIELPSEFKEVETLFNSVKMEIRNNERTAKEAEQRKNDLVVYLAHDLKTPLTSIIGYLTLLSEAGEVPEPLRQKYLGIALDKSERLEMLINEFFEITRFNLTQISLELRDINLTRLLEQLIYEFSPIFAEKGLTCRLQAQQDIHFYCDADKMQRVFDNLLKNAVNYSYADTEIYVSMEKTSEGVSVQFTNHGATIPKEKLERLFEQFFRLDSARTSASGGVGLGLAIAKEIIELHGGTISASSSREQISFAILLPFEK